MKKNSVLTFIFACIPGAGQMYMGHMKLGSSTMFLFSLLWFISFKLGMDTLTFLLPVLWFFSFFDTLNKNKSTSTDTDHYIFANEAKTMQSNTLRIIIAFVLILCGGTTLLSFISTTFCNYLPWQISNVLFNLSNNGPKVFVGVFVLYVGCTLIVNKKSNA